MNKILVVLPNWFGETLFATPFLQELRKQLPDAFVATLGWPACREILAHNPCVDEIVDYDEQGRHRSLLGKWRIIRLLRKQNFNVVFILRKSLSRSLILWCAGIPMRVGFANRKSGWLLTQRIAQKSIPQHKSSTYLPLLKALGLSPALRSYNYSVSDSERIAAREQLKTKLNTEGRPLVILHPGANWPHKRWSPERFAALGDRLIETRSVQILVSGGPDDCELAEYIERKMRRAAMILAGQTSLRQLAAYLEQAQLIVANDTGILHIAAALHRRIVALFGPTSPAITGPLGDPTCSITLHHSDCCPRIPCYNPDNPAHAGMDSILVEEVFQAACQLLAGDK